MAVPKRKHSNSRTRKRRTHDALTPPNLPSFEALQRGGRGRSKRFICPHCKQIKEPHLVCSNCGYYHGRQVIEVERLSISESSS